MFTLTLVIPVYNEENQIKACLDAVAMQTVLPDEVLVVDNNCSDRTIEIVRSYEFVSVITESRQGRGYARTTGFNAARSDIIGRIDADSRIDKNWVEHVKKRFDFDQKIVGLTGLGRTSFIPGISFWKTTLFSRSYYWYVHAGFQTITMWGSNMALWRESWTRVSANICNDDSLVHEDQDLSLWVASEGGLIVQDNQMLITANGQAFINLKKALHYRSLYQSTKQRHLQNGTLMKARRFDSNKVQWLLGVSVLYILGGVILFFGLFARPFSRFTK